jgi:hypothetical protein
MKATFFKGVALGSAVSLMTLAATAAFAGTGVGKVFNLGESNRVNARSQLEGATPSAVLNVTNANNSATASGVSIAVPHNDPPLVVNSDTKVRNLNADLLDGETASQLQGATSQSCLNGSAISSIAPTGAATCNTVALPIDPTVAPGGHRLLDLKPSSLVLAFDCSTSLAQVEFTDQSAAPTILSYSYGANGALPTVGNFEFFTPEFMIDTSSQVVGQFIYLDQTTVTTVNISAITEGMDGCEYHGTVSIARRST